MKRSDWPVWIVTDRVQSPFKVFFFKLPPLPTCFLWAFFQMGTKSHGFVIIPFGLSGFSGCENRQPDRVELSSCGSGSWDHTAVSPRFDPTLRFCPFRVPGEEPRQPPHGHHPARPLLQEQVHQADLPGGRGHGENGVMLLCLFVCVLGRFMSDSRFRLLLFKLMSRFCFFFFGSLPFSLYLPAGVGSH